MNLPAMRQRIEAVERDLPTVKDIDLLAYVAGVDAPELLEAAALLPELRAALKLARDLPALTVGIQARRTEEGREEAAQEARAIMATLDSLLTRLDAALGTEGE